MHEIKKIVIIGGGTAGWLAALFAQRNFINCHVTVIESSDIGILGAGEGTTPQFISFLRKLDISIKDVIQNAKGTFKNNIKFTNWNGDNNYYYHNFVDKYEFPFEMPEEYLNVLSEKKSLIPFEYSSLVSELNKIKFTPRTDSYSVTFTLNDFINHGSFALHFDATLLANFLKKVGLDRGIDVIDCTVTAINTDKDNYITSLSTGLKNIECDFVFDCTGFRRLIIGNHYKSEWVDYTHHIPNNKAIPFILENNTGVIPPYTESIAMMYGWVWKIPVQGRYGCGYVFDSSQITDERVLQEIEEVFNHKIISPRSFKFNAGRYKETWVKNCVALGLSTGFIEPLEATSIWTTVNSLTLLLSNLPGIVARNQKYIDHYNSFLNNFNESVLDFIYFHYLTDRNDTPYWQRFKNTENMPVGVKKLVNNYNEAFCIDAELIDSFTNSTAFTSLSFLSVGGGNNFFKKHIVDEMISSLRMSPNRFKNKRLQKEYKSDINSLANDSINHYDIIEYLAGKPK